MEHGCFAHFGGRLCGLIMGLFEGENTKRDASQRINEDASNLKQLPGALEDMTDKEHSNFRYVY